MAKKTRATKRQIQKQPRGLTSSQIQQQLQRVFETRDTQMVNLFLQIEQELAAWRDAIDVIHQYVGKIEQVLILERFLPDDALAASLNPLGQELSAAGVALQNAAVKLENQADNHTNEWRNAIGQIEDAITATIGDRRNIGKLNAIFADLPNMQQMRTTMQAIREATRSGAKQKTSTWLTQTYIEKRKSMGANEAYEQILKALTDMQMHGELVGEYLTAWNELAKSIDPVEMLEKRRKTAQNSKGLKVVGGKK